MTKIEKKIWDWVTEHLEILIIIVGVIASVCIRFSLRGFPSGDMRDFLLPWYDEIKNAGGLSALSGQVGNYNIPYQFMISLFTYLPINPIYAYKIVSVLFDYLLGGVAAWIVWTVTDRNKLKTAIAFVLLINLPTVYLNSAMWGQCDSIYTFFCLLAVVLLLKEKSTWSFVAYGVAFAFKLQAVFMLPWFIFMYVKNRQFSIWKFFIIPAMMIILSLPGVFYGRSVLDTFLIYLTQQVNEYKMVSLNYPSFWLLLLPNKNATFYIFFRYTAIIITFVVLMLEMAYSIRREMKTEQLLFFSLVISYTCVLFLPAMHERYDYLPIIIGLVIAFMNVRTIIPYIGLCMISLLDYAPFLFGLQSDWQVLAVANIGIFTAYMILYLKQSTPAAKTIHNS